eukprot:360622-Chlamydomonas_euryale.AAC.22
MRSHPHHQGCMSRCLSVHALAKPRMCVLICTRVSLSWEHPGVGWRAGVGCGSLCFGALTTMRAGHTSHSVRQRRSGPQAGPRACDGPDGRPRATQPHARDGPHGRPRAAPSGRLLARALRSASARRRPPLTRRAARRWPR